MPLFCLALPYALKRIRRRGGYNKTLKHRWGSMGKLPPKQAGKARIWIQAVSVGEVQAAEPLIERLTADASLELILTTTTSTGYAIAQTAYAHHRVTIRGFPVDFWLFSWRAWRQIQPDLVVLMESELWPEHLHQAQSREVPTLLVNARLSDRSFNRGRWLKPVLKPLMIKPLSAVLAATDQDRWRLSQWGVPCGKLSVSGNLKCDVKIQPQLTHAEQEALRRECGFTRVAGAAAAPFILLGASTWPGEEAILLTIIAAALVQDIDCRLLLVPRHAERRGELAGLLKQQDQPCHFRSWKTAPAAATRIYVADTTGELKRFLQMSDLVFIGKSLPPNRGGQTPVEAAALGKPIVFGPNMDNFRAIRDALLESGAALQVQDAAALKHAVCDLLRNEAMRRSLGTAAQSWYKAQRGATDQTISAIYRELNRKTSVTAR